MATLMENQNRRNPNPNSDLDREETEEGSEGENYFVDIPRRLAAKGDGHSDRYSRILRGLATRRNLRQGTRLVDEYTNEFYQLVARNKLQETEDQLVARYIGELRVQLQDTVNLFDPVNVSSAHQRALIVERQQKRAGNGMFSGGVAIAGTGGAA
ncbi:hypothetical protein CRG98_002850 [Punica granatum]|uniref:Retrotransposon gag domain-containing protein n=1 Tax=Punica granatum TaxID=22663 RepID=A0A2I0L827_PUNGR|nr:hypothetical protein CRG98_002850 [Punica granatum]